MPIVDYEKLAQRSELAFFSDKDISDKNKKVIRRYLERYDVRPATKNKFFKHIGILLSRVPDLEESMHDREFINKVFCNLRESISPGYYGTVINVSKALVRWLNDGELPKGFRDIRYVSKSKARRLLGKEEMWTWEDGLKFSKYSHSNQITAALLTQLDAGFRPSEFIDLKYGDVKIYKDIVIFLIRSGKTGARDVPCHRCVPYFLRWYNEHPTKNHDDPLWVMEYSYKSHQAGMAKRGKQDKYEYPALLKRIRTVAEKANIIKPTDFYSLRHSSCRLDKKENVPLELAAKRHGHCVEFFVEVYGQEDEEERAVRLKSHYEHVSQTNHNVKINRTCYRCGHINQPNEEICYKCSAPLTLNKAIESDKSKEYELVKQESERLKIKVSELTTQMNTINSFMNDLVLRNPEVIDYLAKKAKAPQN